MVGVLDNKIVENLMPRWFKVHRKCLDYFQVTQHAIFIRSVESGMTLRLWSFLSSTMDVDDTESSIKLELVAKFLSSIEPPKIINRGQYTATVISASPLRRA
ncbi:hypothetical protein pipiens_013074 [Culex pipiens pipiens]|uniref:Uncharacterized protein n=1 Tax=Culex pipiens pipiens TaxID=38569 RepID=A0ABD1D0B1_CULPP